MFYKTLLLIGIIFIATVALGADSKSSSIVWKEIFKSKNDIFRVYTDENSFDNAMVENNKISTGTVLAVPTDYILLDINGKKTIVKSVARFMAVDCDNGISFPMMDLYFSVEKPTTSDKPIKTIEYKDYEKVAEQLKKSSYLYTTFCPVYI
jgi:hypothetical protein